MGKSVAQPHGAAHMRAIGDECRVRLAITEISCRITVNVLSAAMAHTTSSSTVTLCAIGRNTEDAVLHWVSHIAGGTATGLR